VSLESTLAETLESLARLREAIDLVRITAVVDRPTGADHALIDRLSDAADDLRGSLEESAGGIRAAWESVHTEFDDLTARQEMARGQKHLNEVWDRIVNDLLSYDQMVELESVGRQRRGEWGAWSKVVLEAFERCRRPLTMAMQRLSMSWQELAERSSTNQISVRTTSVGQQVSIPAEMARAGVKK